MSDNVEEIEDGEWVVYLLGQTDKMTDSVFQDAASYIGSTPDDHQRLRKHLTIIQGGAKRTRGRAWKFVCVVKGFASKQEALSFEWHWQRFNFTRMVVGRRVKRNGKVVKRMRWRHRGGKLTVRVRLSYLQAMLNDKQYAHLHVEYGCGNSPHQPLVSRELLSQAEAFLHLVPRCVRCEAIHQEYRQVLLVSRVFSWWVYFST